MPTKALLHGRYEVERELDRNALVVRDREEREAPLRVLRYPQVADEAAVAALEIELRLLAGLEHPGLARVLDVGRLDDGTLYFLQERVEGESLFSWAVGRDLAQLTGMFAQLLEVLGAIHARGLVVGGRRPLRLMVEGGATPTPRLRVVDPGGLAHEGTCAEGVGLYARLLAPERRVGAAVDRRANLYEAGVVLYELLAGSAQSEAPPSAAESEQVGSGQFPPLADMAPSLPLALAAHVMVLLRPIPEERPRSAAAALEALRIATGFELPVEVPAQGLLPPPFLGRQRELLEGLAWLRPLSRPATRSRTPGGRSDPEESLLIVHGAHGSGRARFLDELAVRAEAEGVRVIAAACGDRGHGVAGALAGVLRRLLADSDGGQLSGASAASRWALSELLPFAASSTGARRPPEIADPARERLRLLDALVEPLLAQARRRPLLLVLRYLDAAAPLERELIVHLARRSYVSGRWAAKGSSPEAEPRLRILASASSPEEGDGQTAALLSLPGARGLALGPLSQRDVVQLAQDRLGVESEPLSLPLRDAMAASAKGVPGRALRLIDDHQRGVALGLAPATSLVDERFARAHEGAIVILQSLAVLRRAATRGLLVEACGLDPSSVDESLQQLLAAGGVQALSDWRYRISSPALVLLVRRVTSRSRQVELARALAVARRDQLVAEGPLAPEAQLELSRLAAWREDDRVAHPEFLDQYGPGAAAHLEALGAWELAADLYGAIALTQGEAGWQWLRRQARAMSRAGQHQAASAACRGLLASGGDWPASARAEVWSTLVGACWASSRDAEAQAALAEAREDLDEAHCHGPAALGLARLLSQGGTMHREIGEPAEASALCESALDLLRRDGIGAESIELRVQLLIQLGQLATLGDDNREAEQLLKASLALQERQGLSREAARTLQLLGNVALARGEFDVADEHWRGSLERWIALEDRAGEAHVRSSLAMAAARRGKLAEARHELERSLRIREEAGDRAGTSACLHNLGYVYACAGVMTESAQAYRRCLALRHELGERFYAASAANNLGWVLVELGRVREARRQLESAYTTRLELGDRRGEAQTLANLAELDLRCGYLGRALTQAAEAQRIRDELGSREESIDSFRRGARIQLAIGAHERARRAAEAAVRGSRDRGLSLQEGPSRLLLGEVLARAGQRAEAGRELERARSCAERVGDQLTLRAALIELAALQLAQGQPDLARARLDSRSVPRPGRLDPLLGGTPPDRHGQLRARERLLRALIELARERGSVSTAARCAEEALTEARRAGLRDLEWRALYARAAVAELRDRYEEALSLTLEAQEVVEELMATVPQDRQEGFLNADPVRSAALRGDSPVAALGVRAGGSESDGGQLQELRAMLGRAPAPTIEPPRRPVEPAAEVAKPAPRRDEPTGGVAREDFAAVVRLNRAIVDEPEIQRAYQALVAAAARLCRGERAYLAVFGDSPDQLSILATHELDDLASPRQRFARRCGFKAAETGQLVLSADVKVDAELKRRTLQLGLGLRSILAAPVKTSDQQRGVLFVDHPFQTGHFRSREVELLEVLADQCAMAVARAALEGALHQQRGVSPGVPQQQLLRAQAAHQRPNLLRTLARFGSETSGLVGRSPAVAAAVRALEEFADTDVSLLVEGPPGVGKGIIARAAHEASRRQGPLVVVDLRELPERGFETELFGHEAGAFAGAERGRLGLIRSAEGGTLLLERLDEATPALQDTLVRALEERSVRPVGADAPVRFDARVVATARDVTAAVQRGELRAELVTLVGEARLALPPLDERPEDKGPLLDAVLAGWEGDPPQIPGVVRTALVERAYPGNARELHAILRAAAARAKGRPLELKDLPRERPRQVQGLALALRDFERDYVQRALRAHEGDLTAAARELGITRRALQTKLRELDRPT